MIWNNKTTLDNFLSKGILINKSYLTLTGLRIETLSCGLKFVPDFVQNKQLDILEAENAKKKINTSNQLVHHTSRSDQQTSDRRTTCTTEASTCKTKYN